MAVVVPNDDYISVVYTLNGCGSIKFTPTFMLESQALTHNRFGLCRERRCINVCIQYNTVDTAKVTIPRLHSCTVSTLAANIAWHREKSIYMAYIFE